MRIVSHISSKKVLFCSNYVSEYTHTHTHLQAASMGQILGQLPNIILTQIQGLQAPHLPQGSRQLMQAVS